MKVLLFSLCLFCLTVSSKAQSYTIVADTTNDCLLEITKPTSLEIRYSMELYEVRYVDHGPDGINIYDGVQSVYLRIANITNYASLAALKNDLYRWAQKCND